MHIPPVHNPCALYFVIGDFHEKCTGSQADSKAPLLDPPRGANFKPPLYTSARQSPDLRSRPQTASHPKEQP
jgi:hypothetical protein